MKVLIAYDGSPHSAAAVTGLNRAGMPSVGDARVLSIADVVLLPPIVGRLVDGEPPPPSLRDAPSHAVEALRSALATARAGTESVARTLPHWSLTAVAQADSPAWGIIRESDDWQPDLVVVGSQGRSAIGRLVIGSVSHKVLTEGRCNVRVARDAVGPPDRPPRIVVGVDGSPGALAALAAVARRTWPSGTEVRLVSADETHATSPDRMREALERAAGQLRASSAGLSVSTSIESGDPKHTLIEHAEKWGADSIFLGARGLAATERLQLGSVSSEVAMRAHCSVEVVHAQG
jgi:nucleotide-binding universal stress UspA family protein